MSYEIVWNYSTVADDAFLVCTFAAFVVAQASQDEERAVLTLELTSSVDLGWRILGLESNRSARKGYLDMAKRRRVVRQARRNADRAGFSKGLVTD